jgi:hypothetical protein
MSRMSRNIELAAAMARDDRFMYQVAAAATIAPQVLSRIVSGTFAANAGQRTRLADALGVTVDDIFPGGDA